MLSRAFREIIALPQQRGYIYLFGAVGTDKFKIGKTRFSVAGRINQLQTGCPFLLRYIYHVYVENIHDSEKKIHLFFEQFHSIGEWFTLKPAEVKECITLMRSVQIDEPQKIFSEVPQSTWTVQYFVQVFPSVTPEQLAVSALNAALSGASINYIIKVVLKRPGTKRRDLRFAHTDDEKTLLMWLIQHYYKGEFLQLPQIQKFLKTNSHMTRRK